MNDAPKNPVKMRMARPWSTTQSMFAKTLGERAMAQSILHLDAHRRLWWINICFVLPTIILSLLGGACNSSQASLVALWPVEDREHVGKVLPLILGLVGLMVSVLNSVQSYLGTARLVESHYIAHTGFSKLQRLIASEVSLPQQERSVSGSEAISSWRTQYDQLLENSPSMSVKLEKRFSKRRDVKKAGIVVPPNIKVKGIMTFEEIEAQMRKKQEEKNNPTPARRGGMGMLQRAASRRMVSTPPPTKGRSVVMEMQPGTQSTPNQQRRMPRGKAALKKETQKELSKLQDQTRGRVASIAKIGFRPPSPSSDSEDTDSPEETPIFTNPVDLASSATLGEHGDGSSTASSTREKDDE